MSDNIFDVKNDRRLGVYLYRAGFGAWLVYILLGASFLREYAVYKTHCGILCAMLMLAGFTASMTYDYYHYPAEFEQRKKWLLLAYAIIATMLYFLV